MVLPLVPRLAAVVIASGCHTEAAGHAVRDSAMASGMPPRSADLAAYRAGREGEIETLRAGRVMAARDLDSVGATAAKLPIEEYRRIAAAMDAYLIMRGGQTGRDAAAPFDSGWLRMDSLRVERLVLMVRLGARAQDHP